MANKNRRTRRTFPIEAKIKAAQDKVERSNLRYENPLAKLAALLKKRNELRTKELAEAVAASPHSYEEILCFVKG